MIPRSIFVLLATGLIAISAAPGQAGGESGAAGIPQQMEGSAATPPRGAKRAEAEKGLNPLWGIPVSMLNATQERPLFAPSRRPPPPPAVAEAAPPPPPPTPPLPAEPEKPQFTLVGTVTGEPQGIAVVRDQTTSALVRVRAGETISGWSLRSVDSRAMTVEKDRQVVTLTLPAPGNAAGGLTPPGLAPVQQAFRYRRQF
jgi:general secretion pathway protein N